MSLLSLIHLCLAGSVAGVAVNPLRNLAIIAAVLVAVQRAAVTRAGIFQSLHRPLVAWSVTVTMIKKSKAIT